MLAGMELIFVLLGGIIGIFNSADCGQRPFGEYSVVFILNYLMPTRLMRHRVPLSYQRPPEPEQHLLLIEVELLGQLLDKPLL